MSNISLDFSNSGIDNEKIIEFTKRVEEIHDELHKNADNINDFVGWLNLPSNYDKEEFERIKKCAEKIKKDSDVLIVIGIGGSYLGARAVIESLSHSFYNCLDKDKRKSPQIFYAGNNISGTYLEDLIELIADKDISLNVISKSGTTTEPAIAFRIFRELLENKYGVKKQEKEYMLQQTKKEEL